MRTRFAPSPTGYLHLGHVMAAHIAVDFAAIHHGDCLLRIEDTDHTRCKPEYTQAILGDLDWLGINFTDSIRSQSAHYPDYAKVVINLLERGLAYPCLFTRGQIKAGCVPEYDAATLVQNFGSNWRDDTLQALTHAAQHTKPSLPFSIRLNLGKAVKKLPAAACMFEETGPLHTGTYDAATLLPNIDPIIARKDIGCSYMVAGPHDDAVQGMTHIVRGADLFTQTPLQILLQALMDWPRPIYHHHGLIMRQDGKKLSKRSLAESIGAMRDNGMSPQDVLAKALP